VARDHQFLQLLVLLVLLMRIDNQKTKMEFTVALRKVIQWLVDHGKMITGTELQAVLA